MYRNGNMYLQCCPYSPDVKMLTAPSIHGANLSVLRDSYKTDAMAAIALVPKDRTYP